MSTNKHKYDHPKIMLVDVGSETVQRLRQEGYAVAAASLGTPYLVPRDGDLHPLIGRPTLPYDYKEQEIVIIDLQYDPISVENYKGINVPKNVDTWWVAHEHGMVNPRLLNGRSIRDDFDRILNIGGIFVIFTNSLETGEFQFGHIYGQGHFHSEEKQVGSNWGFLSITSYTNSINPGNDHGSMMQLHEELPKKSILPQILSRHLDQAHYDCTIMPGYATRESWMPILINKFDIPVSGTFLPTEERRGWVFIFPQLSNKEGFILELVENYFPAIAPALFPDTKLATWTSQPEYELQSISKLRQKIVEIRENARLEVNRLEESIQSEQEENNYLFDLARETGNPLVEAVKTALQVLGFLKVVDVDELLERDGIQRQNREDLQIHDHESTLVVEIKGISHYPTDENALTVQKYVVLRMREWNRVNVKGMSIVNHQRHIPPLDRDNKMPFRQDVIDAATEQEIGLLTGWDLHRLVRSYVANGWKHADVEGLLFKSGRIAIVPAHYQEIGTIERFIERINVVGIRLVNTLQRDDRIAFELPVMFKEQNCASLQYENKTVDEASAGMLVGVVSELSKEEARVGVRVFRVITAEI